MATTELPFPDLPSKPNVKTHTVLLVDESQANRYLHRQRLESARDRTYLVFEAWSGEIGLNIASKLRQDCIVLSPTLPDLDVENFLSELRASGAPPCAVIVASRDELVRDVARQVAHAIDGFRASGTDHQHEVVMLSQPTWSTALNTRSERAFAAGQGCGANTRSEVSTSRRSDVTPPQLRLLINSLEPMFAYELGGSIVFWNRGAQELYGFSQEEALGRTSDELLATNSGEFLDTLHRTEYWAGKLTQARRDGSTIFVDSRQQAFHQPDGSILILAINRQISAPELLADGLLSEAIKQSTTGVTVLGLDGTVLRANQAMSRLLGYSEAELTAMTAHDMGHPDDWGRDAALLNQLINGEISNFELDKRFVAKNGTVMWCRIRASAILEGGQPRYVCRIIEDISEQKKVEAALSYENAELQQFANSVSHDLQEPLRAISVFSQLLAKRCRSQVDDGGQKLIDDILEGCERMNRSIMDLLNYARAGAEQQEKLRELVACDEAFEEIIEMLEPRTADAGATIVHSPLPKVRANPAQVRQLFQNLVGNALKYSHPDRPPRIEVTARGVGRMWEFCVSDNGIGFDPKFAERIFGVFTRLHGRTKPGSGMGLAIAKRIVERHGGHIWASSEPDAGSRFYFTLPASLG